MMRGTTNRNVRGNSADRAARRAYLLRQFQSNYGEGTCRCFRCGVVLDDATVTVDRIVPGCRGGRYVRSNIRPACTNCNSETGGAVRGRRAACPPPSLTNASFADPFHFLDAKLAEFKAQREPTRDALKSYGWILRPNHPLTGVWRARRWTKREGTMRLVAPSSDDLVALAKAEQESRANARAAVAA